MKIISVFGRKFSLALLLLVFTFGCAVSKNEQATPPILSQTSTQILRSPNTITSLPPSPTKPSRFSLTPVPTLRPLELTALAYYDECGGYPIKPRYDISPDAKWFITVCRGNGDYTRLARFDGTREWIIPAIYKGVDEHGNPFNPTYYKFYRWSVDGKHIYLSKYSCCIDGPQLLFVEAFGLYRFNLNTGKFDAEYNAHGFSLSPSEQYYVFVAGENSPQVNIRNLISLEQVGLSLKEKYKDVGMFTWSPDEENLLFIAGVGDWYTGTTGFSVFSYNLKSRQLKLLVDNDLRYLTPASSDRVQNLWIDNETIILVQNYDDTKFWKLNINTGELTPYELPK